MKELVLLYIAWNFIVFIIYGVDKMLAKRGARRISERTLLTLAFFMGAVGAIFGMYTFRHKTRKTKFRILVPLYVVWNVIVVYIPDIFGAISQRY